MAALLTKLMVEAAVDILKPGVENLIKSTNRVVAYIYVLDPIQDRSMSSEPVQIWGGSIGLTDRLQWPKPYSEYAWKKADLTWKTQLPSHLVQRDAPYLFEEGDFKYGGSEYRNGIIVATSGLEWHHDYLVSASLAAILHAMAIGAFETELKKESYYIG